MRQIFQLLLVVLTPFVLCEREGSGKGIRATDEDQEGYRVSIQIAVGWLQELADETGEGITNSTLFLPTDAAFKELAEILELDDVEDLNDKDVQVEGGGKRSIGRILKPNM
eukprot:1160731-Pelagomonas_calceolata.AAC.11